MVDINAGGTRPAGDSTGSRPFGVRTIDDMTIRPGSRALVRAALDLSFDDSSPLAEMRLELLCATVCDLRSGGAEVTVFGDPASGADGREPGLRPLLRRLQELGVETVLLPREAPADQTAGLVHRLVSSHDVYVDDCFQWSFLALEPLTVSGPTLPCFAGRELEHNLRVVAPLLSDPERPFTAVVGGDHVLPRLHGLQGMVLRADHVLVGGAMSLPLLRAVGRAPERATSRLLLDECRNVVGLGERVQHRIHLPHDLVVRSASGAPTVLPPGGITDEEILDLGPKTVTEFAEVIEGSSAIVWTGAVGHVEDDGADSATQSLARVLPVGSARIVLGGDALAAALKRFGTLPAEAGLVTATDPLLELLKTGDLAGLAPLRVT